MKKVSRHFRIPPLTKKEIYKTDLYYDDDLYPVAYEDISYHIYQIIEEAIEENVEYFFINIWFLTDLHIRSSSCEEEEDMVGGQIFSWKY